ncbi:hypothetical protein [Actinomyces massiliensis]|nr:hypothetical protein [Actinomyces massiliensis]
MAYRHFLRRIVSPRDGGFISLIGHTGRAGQAAHTGSGHAQVVVG